MVSTNSGKRLLGIAGKILILLIVAIGALKSGTPANYVDANGFLFILVGGVALLMISFPYSEARSAFRHAAGGTGSDAEIRNSTHFWEAAGRSFWVLGGLSSVLSIVIGFEAMATQATSGWPAILPMLIRALLAIFYGSLFAVICIIPSWKILGKRQSRLADPGAEGNEAPASLKPSAWGFRSVFGYVLFLAILVATVHLHVFSPVELFKACFPSFLLVLGGTLALMLFMGGSNTRLTPSTAFAMMGLIGSLMGFIQMLHGMTDPTPRGIGKVAFALAFILAACFTALLGMALIGSPLEDQAIRSGRVGAPSSFSRVSWYVFPLLSLIFLVLVFCMIVLPLSPPR